MEFLNTFNLRISDLKNEKENLFSLSGQDIKTWFKDLYTLKISMNTSVLEPTLREPPAHYKVINSFQETLQKTLKKVIFIHINEKNEEIAFTSEMESDGTLKLFILAPFLLDILQKGKVLVVDEIDNSLHPLLVQGLLKNFQNSENKQSNAQLICTTHDVSLLNPELLRRDQIWFTANLSD